MEHWTSILQAMSLEDLTVSFKLQSGEIFDGICMENVEQTRAEIVYETSRDWR